MIHKHKHVNFTDAYTYHAYLFLEKTNQVDTVALLAKASELAEAEADSDPDESWRWMVAKEDSASEEQEPDDAELKRLGLVRTGLVTPIRAEKIAILTYKHFKELLYEWFENECWPLIDDYDTLDEKGLGVIWDATDIKDHLMNPLAAAACHEISWWAVAEALLRDAGKWEDIMGYAKLWE